MIRHIVFIGAALMASSCVTPSQTPGSGPKEPPSITKDISLEDALQAGIDFGGDTAKNGRKLVTKRKQWPICSMWVCIFHVSRWSVWAAIGNPNTPSPTT